MWGGYNNVATRVDGVARDDGRLLDDRPRRPGSRVHHRGARARQAVPAVRDAAGAALGGRDQPGRHDDPASPCPEHEVRRRAGRRPARRRSRPTARTSRRTSATPNRTPAQGQEMCAEPAAGDHDRRRRVRRDDAAAVRPRRARQHAGDLLLGQRLHVGRPRADREVRRRTSRPCACRCSCAGPARSRAGTATGRLVSYVDLLPTMLAAAGSHRAGRSARRWTASRCSARAENHARTPSTSRTRRTARCRRGG